MPAQTERPRFPSSLSVFEDVIGGRSLDDEWNFLEKNESCNASTAAVVTASQTGGGSGGGGGCRQHSADHGTQGYEDLAPFVKLSLADLDHADMLRYDAELDFPLPRSHSEVVRAKAAKSAAARRRRVLHSSEEATRPFSRLNRSRTAALLMTRELRSRQEIENAQNASLNERGIGEDLTEEVRGMNVMDQARHPRLHSVPLLSRVASSSGATQGRGSRETALIMKSLELVEDDDHRAAAVNMQGQDLDDAWAALLGSTLEANRTVRSVMLNRNRIGDRGVALLAQSLRANISVETLSLGGNRLTDEAARSLASLLRSGRSSLKVLNMADVTPKPASTRQIVSGGKEPPSEPGIGVPGATALALALGDPASNGSGCFLVSLNLAHQRIQDAGAVALAAALKRPSCHLEVLGLSDTQLTDVAALAFSRALAEGKSGEATCEQGAGGSEGETMVARCPLRRLDLSRNGVTDVGARALAAGLLQDDRRHRNHHSRDSTNGPGTRDTNNAFGDAGHVFLESSSGEGDGEEAEAGAVAALQKAATTNSSHPPSGCFLGLDLALNAVGPAGAGALGRALAIAAGMVFLELRCAANNGRLLYGGSSGSSEFLEAVEKTCAERRLKLKASRRLGLRRERSSSDSSVLVRSQTSLARGVGVGGGGDGNSTSLAVEGGVGGETVGSGRHRGGTKQDDPTMEAPGVPHREHSSVVDEGGAFRQHGYARKAPRAKTLRCGSRPVRREGARGQSPPGGSRVYGAVRARPLQGVLPMRGYYVSPLVDSRFDLLMLREPVIDPADPSSYVNRTRDKLGQRRAQREGGGGDGRGGGGPRVSWKAVGKAGEHLGVNLAPFPKGAVVSPLAIQAEREQVLAERRRLFSVDSDFASRKNARIAGRGSSSKTGQRSKLLTKKHSNTAFTRELMMSGCGTPGVGAKCPRALRAHFVGLQNFEYDWGTGG